MTAGFRRRRKNEEDEEEEGRHATFQLAIRFFYDATIPGKQADARIMRPAKNDARVEKNKSLLSSYYEASAPARAICAQRDLYYRYCMDLPPPPNNRHVKLINVDYADRDDEIAGRKI